MKLIDSHCHILDPRLADQADEIVANLGADGLECIIEISACVNESKESLAFAQKHEKVFCTIGVHPHVIHEYDDEFERWALAQVSNKKIVGFGECGLDYCEKFMPNSKELQKQIFTRQIILADKMKLPLVVHERESFEDTMQVLIENKKHINHGLLLHCFSECEVEVKRVREHFDAYFAFGGAITFKNNKVSNSAIKAIPLDRILVETDSPYLSPEPFRGKLNQPKNVRIIAEFIAGVLDMPLEKIAKVTTQNTKRFFGIN